jgi:hypothetical protein
VFQTVSLLHELWRKTCRTGAINAQVRATKSCQNFSQWTHPIHPIWTITHVLGHFGSFRYCKSFGAKWAELVQLMHNFVQWSRAGMFRILRTRSTLLHWNSYFGAFQIVSLLHELRCLGAFWTVSLLPELRCKMGRTRAINALVRAMKSGQKFSQRTHRIHLTGLWICGVSDRFVTARTLVRNVPNRCN